MCLETARRRIAGWLPRFSAPPTRPSLRSRARQATNSGGISRGGGTTMTRTTAPDAGPDQFPQRFHYRRRGGPRSRGWQATLRSRLGERRGGPEYSAGEAGRLLADHLRRRGRTADDGRVRDLLPEVRAPPLLVQRLELFRSEERRVGKEGR